MRLSALFEEFCDYLRVEKEAAPKTVTTYRSRFEDFIEFARLETKQPTVLTSHFTVDLCRAYQYALDRRGCQANPDTSGHAVELRQVGGAARPARP
jgi:site-specific recombinase XerD